VKRLFYFPAILVALLAAINTLGQQPTTPWLTEAERAQFDKLHDSGINALYNLEYDKARRDFSEIARLFPQFPAGPQYLASSLWIETLYKSRRLQASLYSTKSFYSNSEEKPDPKVVAQFRDLTRQAQKLSEARLKAYPKDVEALYFLGATQALKASFEEAVERRHYAALKDGSEAVDRHRDVIKLDPNFHDAEVTIGMYDYVVGTLSFPMKLMAGIVGAHGSKKRGLATIERVAKDGKTACDQAKTLLIVLYTREKRYGEAATTAQELATKYPRNYLYRLEAADALISQSTMPGETDHAAANQRAAFDIFESLLHDKILADTAAPEMDLIHFKYAEALMKVGRSSDAAAEFLAATKVEGAEPQLVTMAYLYAARALDAGKKRDEAMAQYRIVLSRPDVFECHDEARKGLKEPYKIETNTTNIPK
jgi:tetratricopeptide (TPR) repeat protein